MTSVELVKNICKSRKIPLSRLEKDLGYSNGYIAQLRKGVFPSDRLAEIAEYLGVSIDSLLCAETDEADGVYRVPVLGRVAAGVPLFAAEEIIDWEELPQPKPLATLSNTFRSSGTPTPTRSASTLPVFTVITR